MATSPHPEIDVADTVTKLGPEHRGRVVIGASHGAVYAGYLAAKAGVRGIILNDAGIGLDGAGIASLAYLDDVGLAAATVDCMSARIGDGLDMATRGIISHVNEAAAAVGCAAGMPALACALAMRRAAPMAGEAPGYAEARFLLREHEGEPKVWGLDSASLVRPEDAGQIVIAASHGGLMGKEPMSALRVDALACAFNDAGVGIDNAGIGRLPALDRRGIAAVTVDARTARIGDVRSSWDTGRISFVNDRAGQAGVEIGMSLADFADCIVRAGA
jgi:broad specificity phosphatase PhoE